MTLDAASQSGHTPSWNVIFDRYGIHDHDFDAIPFPITAQQITVACQDLERPSQKEVRILCKQDSRESRPLPFRERGLFILLVMNRYYVIVQGEGYVDVPPIQSPLQEYRSEFPFLLETTEIGDSVTQHIDRAYALGLIGHFIGDDSLVLTAREGRYSSTFNFLASRFQISVDGVQTEVDGGYEGANQVVLIEAKNGTATNTIIRQLYYPFRQWQNHTTKPVSTLFFQRTKNDEYHLWHFGFDDPNDYNSIRLLKSARYKITLSHG